MEKENAKEKKSNFDTGYAWIIVLASCLIIMISVSFLSTFEILYQETFIQISGSENATKTATWTFCLFLMTWNFSNFFVGPLCKMASHRFTAITGTVLMGSGIILSAFAQYSSDLYISIGLFTGAGLGFLIDTSILIVLQYFKVKQGLAIGIVFFMMALAGIIAPQIMEVIIKNSTTHISIIIRGAVTFIAFIGAVLFKPNKDSNTKDLKESSKDKKKLLKANEEDSSEKVKNCSCLVNNSIIDLFRYIDWYLLKDSYFILTSLGSAYTFTCTLNFYLLMPLHAESQGCDLSQKGALLSIASATDLVARFVLGWLGDWQKFRENFEKPRRVVYCTSSMGIGITLLALGFSRDYISMSIITALYGVCAGGMASNGPMIYSESFPNELPSAMGLTAIARGFTALSLGPLINLVGGSSGGFQSALWFTGGLSTLCMLIWIAEMIYSSRRNREKYILRNP